MWFLALFALSVSEAHAWDPIKIDRPIRYTRYGSGTSFAVVVRTNPDGTQSVAWAPADNVGPDGKRVERYHWPTWRSGRELRKSRTIPGNGGHALLSYRLMLESVSKDILKKEKAARREERKILRRASNEVLDRARFLNQRGTWIDRERVIERGGAYSLDPIDIKATVLIRKLMTLWFDFCRDPSVLELSRENNVTRYTGGHVQIRREMGREFGFVRITSRSAGIGFSLEPKRLSSFLTGYSSYFDHQSQSGRGNVDSGMVDPRFRADFIEALGSVIPSLPIEVAADSWSELTVEQRSEIELAVRRHNSFPRIRGVNQCGGIF